VVECSPPGVYRLPGEPDRALDRERTPSAGEKRAEALDRRRYERERAAFRGVWKLGEARAGPPRGVRPWGGSTAELEPLPPGAEDLPYFEPVSGLFEERPAWLAKTTRPRYARGDSAAVR
jgi:hypothetical protein